MIDWNRLISDPVLQSLGALLREQFGVWVGVVDAFGKTYPAGDAGVEPFNRPVCVRFCSKAVTLERRATSGDAEPKTSTCARSNRRWNEQATPGLDDVATHCHAGLSAMVIAFDEDAGAARSTHQNTPPAGRACLYISGYVHTEHAYERLGNIRALLKANQLAPETEAATDAMMDTIPRLDRREREFMRGVAGQFVARARRLLGEDEGDGAAAKIRVPGTNYYGMIGSSRPVLHLFDTISMVAHSNSTILIQGENGTGKELIARALHAESPRRDRPFVALNCAAVASDLIASELFGHKRGAFSGAHRDRDGLVEEANGGTLFLDEIGDMELHLQVKLLRFLQEGTFIPVGGSQERKVNVRVLCATNQDLEALVREGKFRKDLFFRVNVINLVSPPLRARKGDIEVLANHFLSSASKRHHRPQKSLSAAAMQQLRAHAWPGNVRELENEIERLVILSGEDEVIGAQLLSERISPTEDDEEFGDFDGMQMPDAVERLERAMMLKTLRETGWNKSETARILGVSRRNLIRKVARFKLEGDLED
ncbi:sigma-54 interaction domain-containing protein [Bradymonas sediminis]|uniref:Nitrogen fixation protein NifA n=1 Tax=Bradymonas sediminis TaxID=1548548 RepID=A0A2Z4FKE0_9DELT|nr:sigma-54 dependent transcriptional regulator [Bradymonas sediminis]AWV89148.1 nitrogen fixation protein NifA [Bradymonas sediminis]TDP64386.1 regulatory Fis family protein [Bradymonas sediminis]